MFLEVVLGGAPLLRGTVVQPRQAAANPLAGKRLYVDPNSSAQRQAETLRRSRPQDAALLEQIADKPAARWLGGWASDIAREVDNAVSTITRTGAVAVFVAYNIPGRDCGQYSAGGANGSDAYRKWIRSFASGLRGRQAIAARLRQADIANADGFSLNVSNYIDNAANIAFGERVSRLVGGKHFIIDTSRNGLGNATDWCNPRGQALGVAPTTSTGHPLVDAFLWIKQPGESDGTCKGGPKAGAWWTEIALELSRAASTLARTIAK